MLILSARESPNLGELINRLKPTLRVVMRFCGEALYSRGGFDFRGSTERLEAEGVKRAEQLARMMARGVLL